MALNKNQEDVFLGMLLGNLRASMLGTRLTGKGVMKVVKGVARAGTEYKAMCHMDKIFTFTSCF